MFAECDDKSTLFFRKSLDCCLHITVIIYYCLVWFFALCVCMCGFFLFPCSLFFLACCIVRVISPESLHLKKKPMCFHQFLDIVIVKNVSEIYDTIDTIEFYM